MPERSWLSIVPLLELNCAFCFGNWDLEEVRFASIVAEAIGFFMVEIGMMYVVAEVGESLVKCTGCANEGR